MSKDIEREQSLAEQAGAKPLEFPALLPLIEALRQCDAERARELVRCRRLQQMQPEGVGKMQRSGREPRGAAGADPEMSSRLHLSNNPAQPYRYEA